MTREEFIQKYAGDDVRCRSDVETVFSASVEWKPFAYHHPKITLEILEDYIQASKMEYFDMMDAKQTIFFIMSTVNINIPNFCDVDFQIFRQALENCKVECSFHENLWDNILEACKNASEVMKYLAEKLRNKDAKPPAQVVAYFGKSSKNEIDVEALIQLCRKDVEFENEFEDIKQFVSAGNRELLSNSDFMIWQSRDDCIEATYVWDIFVQAGGKFSESAASWLLTKYGKKFIEWLAWNDGTMFALENLPKLFGEMQKLEVFNQEPSYAKDIVENLWEEIKELR